jgi:hypothetical protein
MSTYSIRCSDGNVLKDLSGDDLFLLADVISALINSRDACETLECDSGRKICVANHGDPRWKDRKEAAESWLAEATAKENEIAAFLALKGEGEQ